jgi:hypothetical protein
MELVSKENVYANLDGVVTTVVLNYAKMIVQEMVNAPMAIVNVNLVSKVKIVQKLSALINALVKVNVLIINVFARRISSMLIAL